MNTRYVLAIPTRVVSVDFNFKKGGRIYIAKKRG